MGYEFWYGLCIGVSLCIPQYSTSATQYAYCFCLFVCFCFGAFFLFVVVVVCVCFCCWVILFLLVFAFLLVCFLQILPHLPYQECFHHDLELSSSWISVFCYSLADPLFCLCPGSQPHAYSMDRCYRPQNPGEKWWDDNTKKMAESNQAVKFLNILTYIRTVDSQTSLFYDLVFRKFTE